MTSWDIIWLLYENNFRQSARIAMAIWSKWSLMGRSCIFDDRDWQQSWTSKYSMKCLNNKYRLQSPISRVYLNVWNRSATYGQYRTNVLGSSPEVEQTRDIDPMLDECWPIVYDAGPIFSQHWVNVSCLLGSKSGHEPQAWAPSVYFPNCQVWTRVTVTDCYVRMYSTRGQHIGHTKPKGNNAFLTFAEQNYIYIYRKKLLISRI